jgi:hypothetical protein
VNFMPFSTMFDSGNVFDSLETLCYLCTSFLEQESITQVYQ